MEKIRTVHHEGIRHPKTDHYDSGVKKKRIAAYCRVSTLQEEQDLYCKAQKRYYQALFENREDCELIGIYGDEGISGRLACKRPGFLKMMNDCRKGKVDEIHTRSVSRFARNYAECIEYVRELNQLGIPVCFEKENLNTSEKNIDLLLSILAIISQEESNSISMNITLAQVYRNRKGDPIRAAVYGYVRDGEATDGIHQWHIKEDEADRVRMVFELFLAGESCLSIAEKMNAYEEIHGVTRKWTKRNVIGMLTNEAYAGDLLTHKSYTVDYLNHVRKKNEGEKEQQYLQDHHPAIISQSDFVQVQLLLGRGIPVCVEL